MRKIFLFALVVFFAAPMALIAQSSLSDSVPVDPAIRIGKLENGMTYYIRHNEEPKERVSFYIIQNVGALLEEDNQNGLAHFLEHMAFNGTEHFEGKGIINYLEKNGVAFGRNINAYTAYNETVYNISDVPSTSKELVDSCLLVLHDWSNFLLLTEEEIDAERGVISEEWRTRRNAGYRLRDQYNPVLLKGSKWAERDIIGDLNIIKTFDYETIRKFYHDWYRTDLQAIAIVGDVDVDDIENKVKQLFSKIPAVENPKPRPVFEIPEHEGTRFVLATDVEATNSSVQIYIKHKSVLPENKNIGYLREDYVSRLFNQMARDRISELLQKGNPPFINGGIQIGGFLRGYEVAYLSVTAKPNMEDEGLKVIYTEAQRIVRYGFTEGELNRAKTNMLTGMESAYKQRDKIRNDQYASAITSHFLQGEPLTDADFDWQFGQSVLHAVTIEEVNELARNMIVDKNRVVIVQGPKDDVKHLTQEEAFTIIEDVEKSEITPYEDIAEVSSLIKNEPVPSEIISTKELEEFDAVEWTFANNAKVVFRHADFEKDNVSLRAYSPGGTSIFEEDDLSTAKMIGQFIGNFGVGDFDAITLKKVLAGKRANVNIGLGPLSESFNGFSTPKDFETMMQLLHLQFSNPRFDKEAYDALKSRYVAFLSNMANDPKKIMQDSLNMIFTNYNERTKLMNLEMLDEISFNKMEELYKDRFQDAGDFIFFIVGNIEKDVAREMSAKYIGSLEDDLRVEDWIDRNVRSPKGKTEKQIAVPFQTKKANVNVVVKKEMSYSPESNLELSILGGILRLRYTEEIREKEGGTYGVSVSAGSRKFPVESKTLQMKFDTDPKKAEHLKTIIFSEIDKIVKNGPSSEDLEKVILNMRKEREQSKAHNNYWMNTIYNYYYTGYNFDAPDNFDKIIDETTPRKIQEFTKCFMESADNIDVVFVPKAD